ncbi:MAG: T9SS type A sorting domain-containing protein [candidate division WOR-3 bacterium]|nr:T9SS type A sorting domain-containing protein [candidate division WOR-3 bacterium]
MLLLLFSLSISKILYLRTDQFVSSKYSQNLYITTDGGGLLVFNPKDSTWESLTTESGLLSNTTKDIFIRNDSICVLTPKGLTLFNRDLKPIGVQAFNPLFFNDTNPNTIEFDNAKVILGGEKRIQWFPLSDFGNINREVDYVDYDFSVFDILVMDFCYLLGTTHGIYRTALNFRDTVLIDSSGATYTLKKIGNSIWAGGSWGCRDITEDTASFSAYPVRQIEEINHTVYIGTKGGLYKFEGGWEKLSSGDVRGICKPNSYDSVLVVVRREGIEIGSSAYYLRPPGLASNKITDLTQTPDEKIYISHSDTKRISVFDNNKWRVLNQNNEWCFPGGKLYNIESDSKGRIYFGFWFWEEVPLLYQWNPEKDSLPKPISLPIPATTIGGMLVDKYNDLWIGALQGSEDWVLRMHRAGENSLEWTVYNSSFFRWIRVFAEGSKEVYCGNSPTSGGAGIHILSREGSTGEVIGNLGGSTVSMASDLKGNIWAGTENGLIHISGDEVKEVLTPNNTGLLSTKVDGLAVDFQGGLWCYHSGLGLSYRDPEGNWRTFEGFSYVGENEVVYPLHFTRNHHLFVGTYKGLYEVDIDFNIPRSSRVNVYPNPFNANKHERLYFSSTKLQGKTIYIYDIYGQLKEKCIVPEGKYNLAIQINFPSGLYLYVVEDASGVVDKGKFVVVR